ncbi:MAG: DUF721 domain-containing protein [Hyphomicrobiales bacterium]|nr:DUF721 domain-containing protein [Hyphomicrobiales bacterium]
MIHPQGRGRTRQVGRPLADLVAPALGKTLATRGFAATDVLLAWPEIIGERLAKVCEPVALEWPRGPRMAVDDRQPATLVIRVEGAYGLEIQHIAPLILERINSHFGWRCAGKLSIRQGPIRTKAEPKPQKALPDADAIAKTRELATEIADEKLRQALVKLGGFVLSKQ